MKKIFCLITFIFCLSPLFGQDYKKIDSLELSLQTMPALNGTDSDTLRLKTEQQIGNLFINSIPDSAMGWYLLSADTAFNSDRIRKYPGRANIVAGLLLSVGSVFNNMGDYGKSIEYCEKALRISNETGDKAGKSKCLMNLGNASTYRGDYKNAVKYFEQSRIMAEEAGNKKGVSDCLSNLGVVSSDLGDYPKAIEYYEQSLKIRTELNDKTGISSCLVNLGVVSMYQGDYPKSIDYFERALAIAEELNDKRLISFCLMNLGGVTLYQGNYSKAIEYDQRALDLKQELEEKKGISQCLLYMAATYFNRGDPMKAIDYYQRSIKINEQIGDKFLLSYCYMNLGNIYYDMEDFTRSDESFGISLRIAEELNDKRNISLCLSRMSYLAYGRGKLPEALDYIERALQIDRELGLMSDLSENLIVNAKLFINNNTPEKAMPLYHESQDIVFSMLKDNFSILSEAEKEDYVNKIKGVFSDIHYFNNNFGYLNDSLPGVCYNNELIIKGLLLKSTSAMLNAVYSSSDPELKETYLSLKQLRNSIAGLLGAVSEEEKAMAAELGNKANDQEKKLVKLSSEFAGIQKLFEYKWEDVRSSLKPGEAAVEFVVFTRGIKNDTVVYAALVITPDMPYPKTIGLFPENDIQSAMGKASGTGYKYVNSLYGTNSTALYRLIWQPLEPVLKGINTVYFAPVGVLNKISFAALSKEPGRMLCDIYNLRQVSSSGKLIGKSNNNELKMTAAVFGGIDYNPDTVKQEHWQYLPGTLNEKESIEKQFKKNKVACIAYSGKEAKEENFKALFDSTETPSILHVSTHGFFYPDPEQMKKEVKVEVKVKDGELDFRGSNGFGNWMFLNNKNPMMRSGLVFAGANRVWSEDWGRTDNEGVLTAYEVSNMNMRNTNLVVLSACETGLGDIKGSEGVYGLQRAFKMAGVKYIIMSLWQVPDKETVEFMELFYKKLLKEKDVRQAFNETQKEMRKKYDPYFWAAFVLIE